MSVSTSQQPAPEQVLGQDAERPQAGARGALKIYFGYAAGVGKTFAMLEAARRLRADGVDVVAGYIEPHERPETLALLGNLEAIPRQSIEYRGVTLDEFDLDAALGRKPSVILVDELAHSNAPGCRHRRRWQDIEELLDAGVDVHTTLNVQHVESLKDAVCRITGVIVRETVPDSVFARADSIELVDIAPDDLLQRFREGKVYMPAQAERAMQRFFQRAHLVALREIALRYTADRMHAETRLARAERADSRVWPTRERLLVCVGASPTSASVVRAAKRMASALDADWLAVTVETPATEQMTSRARAQVLHNLMLAGQMGAEVLTLIGVDTVDTILACARDRNVTKIVLGKPMEPFWRHVLHTTILDRLMAAAGDIDLCVISGVEERQPDMVRVRRLRFPWRHYSITIGVTAACTLLATSLRWLDLNLSDVIMVYLLGVVFVSSRYGRGSGVLSAILSVLAFNFFFTEPYYSFAISSTQYIVTFVVMFVITLVISAFTSRLRRNAALIQQRAWQTETLYRLTRELASASNMFTLSTIAERHLGHLFKCPAAVFLPDSFGMLHAISATHAFAANANELAVAQWVLENNRPAGSGTDTLGDSAGLYVPMNTPQGTNGVLGIALPGGRQALMPDQYLLLQTCVTQVAQALERERLSQQAQETAVCMEREQLRNTLLSSVSHDLRTPLAGIAGASSSLLNGAYSPPQQRELLRTISEEAQRLTRLVENLLNITRIESSAPSLNKEWHPVEELVEAAVSTVKDALKARDMRISLPDDLPLVNTDGVLLTQALANLIENAALYTPATTPIELTAHAGDGIVQIEVADHGPGIPAGELELVFEKFHRGSVQQAAASRGAGLGLAICKAVVGLHKGRVWAENRPEGGARFVIALPTGGIPPAVHEPPSL